MPDNNSKTNNTSLSNIVSTQLPGIDNSQVIASQPLMIKENSEKFETKVVVADLEK